MPQPPGPQAGVVSGPGRPLARPARHVPSQGDPAASHETREHVSVTLKIQERRARGRQPPRVGLIWSFAAVAQWEASEQPGPRCQRPQVPSALAMRALGPPGGRRRPSLQTVGGSARLLHWRGPLRAPDAHWRPGSRRLSFGAAGCSTGLFRRRGGQARGPQCPQTALCTNTIPPHHSLNAQSDCCSHGPRGEQGVAVLGVREADAAKAAFSTLHP